MEQYLSIAERLGSFKTTMDRGAIYFQFDNNMRFAMHKDFYEKVVLDNGVNTTPYKDFVAKLMSDGRSQLVKLYYKSFNENDINDPGTWVDLSKVYISNIPDPYTIAYLNRTGNTIDVSEIDEVEYTDAYGNTHIITNNDGYLPNATPVYDFQFLNPNKYIIKQVNIREPHITNLYHLMNDIEIDKISDNVETLENSLLWINGVFVNYTIDSNDSNKAYIKNGKSFMDTRVINYDMSSISPKMDTPYATLDPDESKGVYRYNMDIRAFKWKGVNVSNFIYPNLVSYKSYIYEYANTQYDIDYADKLFFREPIGEHLLIHNGKVLDKDDYYILDDGYTIQLRSQMRKVLRAIDDVIVNVDATNSTNLNIGNMVESQLISGGNDYALIKFTSSDPSKVAKCNRSKACLKNYPYPFNVTFPEYNSGDLILLDGIYEKYVIQSANSIRYVMNDYMTRLDNGNLLSETSIERVWISLE